MTTPLKTRVLLADDHEVVRSGLRLVLDSQPDIEVVAEAGDGAEAVRECVAGVVDLAVIDVSMPRMTGLQAAEQVRVRAPGVRVLMLSMHDNEQYFFAALKAGASGYVLKSAASRDLVDAVRASMRGEPFLYPPAVTALFRDYLDRARNGEADAPAEPADGPRARGAEADRRGPHERRDRVDARDQPAHRRASPREHPAEARHARSRGVDPLRDPARAHRGVADRMGVGRAGSWAMREPRHAEPRAPICRPARRL